MNPWVILGSFNSKLGFALGNFLLRLGQIFRSLWLSVKSKTTTKTEWKDFSKSLKPPTFRAPQTWAQRARRPIFRRRWKRLSPLSLPLPCLHGKFYLSFFYYDEICRNFEACSPQARITNQLPRALLLLPWRSGLRLEVHDTAGLGSAEFLPC